MTERERKRAFAVVVIVVAAAVTVIAMLGRNDGAPREVGNASSGARRLVIPPDRSGEHATSTAARVDPRAAVQSAAAVARRFAVAYLARESGDAKRLHWRDLRSTSTASLWQTLQQPVRIPLSVDPPRARIRRLNGISETAVPDEVAAAVEYRRGGATQYLRIVLTNDGGRWRASRISP
jgi:hypothetical protein